MKTMEGQTKTIMVFLKVAYYNRQRFEELKFRALALRQSVG